MQLSRSRLVLVLGSALALSGCGLAPSTDAPASTANPILFVTQVPVVSDFLTVTSTFGNHEGSMRSTPRGGDLWIRYPDGELRNLTAQSGYGRPDGFQGAGSIAVRDPCVHWSGNRALFSMVVGAPESPADVTYHWQLYEVRNLRREETPTIERVPFQPANHNNVAPAYSSDGRVLFVSDRPRGAAHLFPQLDEYEEAPTNTGIWSLDPATGEIFLMNHSASGSFEPVIDSFGRVVFSRWDHLERDQQSDFDRMGQGNYQVFNYSSEAPDAFNTGSNLELFPEPRKDWIDWVNSHPNYSGPLAGWEPQLVGNTFNHFQLWTLNQDGTVEETLNHVGRQELFSFIDKSRNDDPNVVNHFPWPLGVSNRSPLSSFHQVSEDRRFPGRFYGIDCREFDTHASGQVVRISGAPSLNGNLMQVDYVTHRDTQAPTQTPGPDHSGFYRDPVVLSDGMILASHTANTQKDSNLGTPSQPRSRFDFRLKALTPASNGYLTAGSALTGGIRKRVQYYDPFNLVTQDGLLWELDAVEVVQRPAPPVTREPALPNREQQALNLEGVALGDLRQYLRANDLALIVSRNVTARDHNDRQQPYNLRVPGGVQTTGASGTVYDVAYLRLFQGDLIRGITNGVSSAFNGRRVLAQPLHEPAADNPPAPNGPSGSVQLGSDGSMAALVPARRAMSWQLNAPGGAPVVNERYWVSFQPGEIRTCFSCHGLNEVDQADRAEPDNVPLALRTLLQHLKSQGHL